ncbi:DUF3095 domain-containing protein [Mesorhizobium sp. NBSH29]|uniref:DUF3095 domain-containing protein n=1 Tax=Mesorhizobium sp. NBSH29 TaxID=2654249 RepID=UPI00189680D3|nr:DUF3095 domain-containing protein [Mesorhizobium sp. NBSH29]
MDNSHAAGSFFDTLPILSEFGGVADTRNYRPLPDDWALAVADIVNSTDAVAKGRYKSVNMAGASVISALLNTLGRRDLPFIFGGDGAMVAFPLSLKTPTTEALSAVQTWVGEELDLVLRAAIVPLGDIRAHGLDVRVARFQAADEVFYAMFSGGGSSWAESEMKAGKYRVPAAPAGTRPDLTGLSCRWDPIKSSHGAIVSIIATPGDNADAEAFADLVSDIVKVAGGSNRAGHPVPADGGSYSIPPKGLDLEARAAAPPQSRFVEKLKIIGIATLMKVADALGMTIGSFDPKQYRQDVVQNSDFRKFDDGLKMTIDVDTATADEIEKLLETGEKSGVCKFGMHRQDLALMTCMVASPLQRDHVHFVDGAAGGYAMAAAALKSKMSGATTGAP